MDAIDDEAMRLTVVGKDVVAQNGNASVENFSGDRLAWR